MEKQTQLRVICFHSRQGMFIDTATNTIPFVTRLGRKGQEDYRDHLFIEGIPILFVFFFIPSFNFKLAGEERRYRVVSRVEYMIGCVTAIISGPSTESPRAKEMVIFFNRKERFNLI